MDTIEKAIQRMGGARPAAPPRSGLVERAAEQQAEQRTPGHDPVAEAPATPRRDHRSTRGLAPKRAVSLDLNRLRQSGMVVPDDKRSRIKEEYRHIKRPLLMNASGKGATILELPNLVMVTSSRPGEGKTFTATNLALSIAAERDRTVLLVDSDVLRHSLSSFFGLDDSPGLVDFLTDDSLNIEDVLVATDVPSLTLLPAGKTHHLSTELLASNSMRELVHNMSTDYPERIVIFDSPPLLSTSEASVLANLVGQLVMVVEAERTPQSQVNESLALLNPDMAVGFVLNKSKQSVGSDYYYGYGYYGGSGD